MGRYNNSRSSCHRSARLSFCLGRSRSAQENAVDVCSLVAYELYLIDMTDKYEDSRRIFISL